MLARLRWLFAGTLRRQLVVGMSLVVASMTSVFVWDLTRRQEAGMLEQQSEQALALARSVAAASTAWVASRDLSGIQEIVEGFARYPDLRYLIVLDRAGQIYKPNTVDDLCEAVARYANAQSRDEGIA